MYKMEINVSGQQRAFLFRGPGCRKTMLEWWRDHLDRAEAGEDIRSIRVWGTVGNKTDIVRKWAKFPTLSASLSMPPAGGAHERRRGLPDGQIAAAAHRVADGGMDHGK